MLTPADISQLDRLALGTSASHATTSAAGLRHARARGYGLETSGLRPYQTGDDPRLIDWNAEARLRQLAVRVMAAEGQARIHVVVDTSASLGASQPSALRWAAALLYLATARRDLAGLSLVSDHVVTHVPPAGGQTTFARLAPLLASAAPRGGSDLDGTLREVAHRVRPPAFVVVCSDFFAPGFGLDGLRALSVRGLDPAAIQIVPDDAGDAAIADGARVRDAETGVEVVAHHATYRARRAAMTADLTRHCATHGIPFVQLPAPTPFDRALDALIRAGILAGRH